MDYLSNATRKKQSALLIFCLTSISVSVFRLRLTKIENAGFDLLVPEYLLSFVLVLSVVYLFISYLVAFLDEGYQHIATDERVIQGWNQLKRLVAFEEQAVTLFHSANIEEDFKRFEETGKVEHIKGSQLYRSYLHLKGIVESGKIDEHKDEIRQLAEQSKLVCDYNTKTMMRRKHFILFGKLRVYRILTFDVLVPLSAFACSVAGWFGYLDWVAPQLEHWFPQVLENPAMAEPENTSPVAE